MCVILFFFFSSKANFPAEGTERGKKKEMTLFKEIPVQSMLEMPSLPIKSEMASTSAAAAEGTDRELPLICLQSTESQTQLPVKIHYCEMRCIHKLREGDIKDNFSS